MNAGNRTNPQYASIIDFLKWILFGLHKRIITVFAVGVGVGILEVVLASLVGWLMNQIVATGADVDVLKALIPQIALVVGLFVLAKPAMQSLEARLKLITLQPYLVSNVCQRLFDRVLARPTAQIVSVDPSRFSHKIMRTATVTTGLLMDILNTFSVLSGTLIGVAILLWGLDPIYIIGLLFWLTLAVVNAGYFVPRLRNFSSARARANTEVTGELVDALSNLCSVKLFASETYESRSLKGVLDDLAYQSERLGRHNTMFQTNLFILLGLLPIGLQAGAVYQWLQGVGGPGEVVTLGLIAARISGGTNAASISMMLIYRNLGEIEHGMTLFTDVPAQKLRPPTISNGAITSSGGDGTLRFEDVWFSYSDSAHDYTLSQINLTIPAHGITAIVGPSGSGKSTLLSLLLGLRRPDKGAVYIGGTRIDAMSDGQIAETFALAGQNEAPFNRSLRENVRYGRLEATDEEVDDILDLVGLSDQRVPCGPDAPLGTRGHKLSGGQRQRVLIARALLRDPLILVLDEATSALDYPSERALLAMVAKHRQGKMTIIVTHRPSALPAFDYVAVVENGEIIESGSPFAIDRARHFFDFETSTSIVGKS